MYFFSGLNFSSFGSETLDKTNMDDSFESYSSDSSFGVGYQLGAGFKFSKHLGIELSYVELNSTTTIKYSSDISAESSFTENINTSGMQFQLSANF
jgi:outer membrane protein W